MKLVAALCALICTSGGAPAWTAPASASSCPAAPPNSVGAQFGYDLNDAMLLHLIAALAALPPSRQQNAFATVMAAAAAPPPVFKAALANVCPSLDAAYATARGLTFVENQWNVPALDDDARLTDFATVLGRAATAIGARGALPASIVEAATAPFRDISAATPLPATVTHGEHCIDTPAKLLNAVNPQYPPLAAQSREGGAISVEVRLNEAGDVRSARLSTSTARGKRGEAELIRNSIYSAAVSTYAPEISNCLAIGGTVMLEASYSTR